MRGLKHKSRKDRTQMLFVASFTDAWIETDKSKITGLEPIPSHPLRMRGLKLYNGNRLPDDKVASFTDAWIETFEEIPHIVCQLSHPLRMRGLKLGRARNQRRQHGRILYGCVD